MTENLSTVQQKYEAITGKSRESDPNAMFETEYARKYYLDNLKPTDVQSALAWLEVPENANVQNAEAMKNLLKQKQGIMTQARVDMTYISTQAKT